MKQRDLTLLEARIFFTLFLGLAFFGGVWIGAILSPNIPSKRKTAESPHFTTTPPPSPAAVKPAPFPTPDCRYVDFPSGVSLVRCGAAETLLELTFSAAEKCQVPPRLLFSQVRQESAFRVDAFSSSGAIGLMQIKPYHAFWPLDIWDPETNLNLGACLLRRHYDRMGSWKLALDAYHGGQWRTKNSPETKKYTSKVMEGM